MPRLLILIFLPLLLCQCASKHQPVAGAPFFFDQPEDTLSFDQIAEISQLEEKTELGPLEKKRLWDLYQIEKKNIREESPRASFLSSQIQKLRPEVEALLIPSLNTEEGSSAKESKEKLRFQDPEIRKEVKEAYQAWNQDENEKALMKVRALMEKSSFNSQTQPIEKLQIYKLFFRIAFDLGDVEKATQAFQLLKAEESCGSETAQAGFLLAVLQFAQGKQAEAWDLLVNQCDPDSSLANKTKKAYWLFRFAKEGSSEKSKYYEEVISSSLPGFYTHLASVYQGKVFEIPSYSQDSGGIFSCPSRVEKLIREAESRLQFSLRRDAKKLLIDAKKELLRNADDYLDALIYIARLFQASGEHLEAMKLINTLLTGEGEAGREGIRDSRLISEFIYLYHRPYPSEVEWGAKTWGVDPDFIYSIMRQESAFNPGAVSVAGARGLMQMMPVLGKFLMEQWKIPTPSGKGYLFRGKENIRLATYHLHQLNQIAPHPALVAASYNAGIQRVSTWWRRFGHFPLDVFIEFIPVNETRNYVKLVLRNYIYYAGLRQEGRVPSSLFALDLPPSPFSTKSLSPNS